MVNTKCKGGTGVLFLWFPALAYAAFIFYLSSLTHLEPPPISLPGFDKIMHFFIYVGLGFLTARALYPENISAFRSRQLATFFLAAAYGASDEFHQYFVPGRECSGFDFLADLAGSAAGLYAFTRLIRHLRAPAGQE